MDFISFTTAIWLAGWFITLLVTILVDFTDEDLNDLPHLVVTSLFLWPLFMVILFPVYLFSYIYRLRKCYL